MKPNVAAALCAALVGLLALSQSAIRGAEDGEAMQQRLDGEQGVHSSERQNQARVHG
jgi:hypothetical protein